MSTREARRIPPDHEHGQCARAPRPDRPPREAVGLERKRHCPNGKRPRRRGPAE